MKASSYRFTEEDLDLLKELAEKRNTTQTNALRYAIRHALGIDDSNTGKSDAADDLKDELVRQLHVKDEQIESYRKTLEDTTAALKAAQALHAAEKQERLLAEPAEEGEGEPEGPRYERTWFGLYRRVD